MAGSLNKVMIIGNLGRDPELKYTQSGTPVCTLNIATNEKWRDQQGNWQDRTEWHRVIVWERQGENCANYLRKGSSVFLEGSLQTRKWQDQNGQDRWTTEVKAQRVQFLDGRTQGGQAGFDVPPPPDDYAPPMGGGGSFGGPQGGQPDEQQAQNAPQQAPQQAPRQNEDLGPAFPSEASGMDDVPF